MEIRDILVTPFLLVIIYAVAYTIRPLVTDKITRRYFIPAFTVRILGALALGFIYQFYYDGGDTFNYHTYGSRHIWEALMESPETGFKLLFNPENQTGIYKYSSRIEFFNNPPAYFVIRIAAILDLFTFSSYSATAVLFSVIGFIGTWMFFLTFYDQYPTLHKRLAFSVLFLPSVIFWGSGLLKDTITLACLGIATYCFYKIFFIRKFRIGTIVLLIVSLFVIFSVKKFILQAYIPAVIVWIFASNFSRIRSSILKIALLPIVFGLVLVSGYYAAIKIGEGDERYSVNQLAKTAQITAYDIRFFTGRNAGSGYSLGELNGDWRSMIRLAPGAINVSLFRPYLWEVRNPLMLMSALESLFLLGLTVYVIARKRLAIFTSLKDPNVIFMLVFSIVFACAIGIATFNFGTLVRYKIPLLPFYTSALFILLQGKPGKRNVS